MAILVNLATGNFNTAGTWGTATQLVAAHATTNLTISTGTYYSSTFTAPNTTNANLGLLVAFTASGASASGTVNFALQEYNGSTWSDVATQTWTVPTAVMSPTPDAPMKILWASGYTYTTTSAGYYRYKITRTGTFSASPTVWVETTTSQFWACSIDDRGNVPTTSDDVIIAGDRHTVETVTLDASQTFGTHKSSGGTGTPTNRTWATNNALTIAHQGELIYSTSAGTYDMTLRGFMYVTKWGYFKIGSNASPYPTTCTASLTFAQNGVVGNYGFSVASTGTFWTVGSSPMAKTFSTLVSGAGTTASPLVTADSVDWAVGDEIGIAPTGNGSTNYLETEWFFVRTKNSATSYTLSATPGGAEIAGFTYTHDVGATIVHITRNIIIQSDSSSYGWFGYNSSTSATYSFITNWTKFKYVGAATSGRYGIYFNNGGASARPELNYCVFEACRGQYDAHLAPSTVKNIEYKENFFVKRQNAGGMSLYLSGLKNKTLRNFIFLDGYRNATNTLSTPYCRMYDFQVIAMNKGNSVTYPQYLGASQGGVCSGYQIHCCPYGIALNSSATTGKYTNWQVGTKGYNRVADIYVPADTGSYDAFKDCEFGSPTFISGYLSMVDGAILAFENFNGTQNYDFWHTNAGIFSRTGVGLTDTTVRTAGGYGLKSVSENTNPMSWAFDVPTGDVQNQTMSFLVWVKINSANYYGGSDYQMPTLTITYDGGTTATAVATATTDWQLLAVPVTASTTTGIMNMQIDGYTDQTGTDATVYYDDVAILFPAGYQINLGSLDEWSFGQPITPPIATLLSANDVWSVPISSLTGTTSVGGHVVNSSQKTIKYIVEGEIPLT